MVQLTGSTSWALLTHDENGTREFQLLDSLKSALGSWGSRARLSPVFPLKTKASDATANFGRRKSVIFIGPIFPGQLPDSLPGTFYLTYGLLNLLWVGNESDFPGELLTLPDCGWEKWTLEGNTVVEAIDNLVPTSLAPASIPSVPASLRAPAEEYAITLTALSERATGFPRDTIDFLKAFEKGFKEAVLANDTINLTAKHTELVLANAALSRYASQTFLGIRPLQGAECPFWPHSLLGIGTASRSLITIRKFIESAFLRANLIGRVLALKEVDVLPDPLVSYRLRDQVWLLDHLTSYPSQSRFDDTLKEDYDPMSASYLPLLTCFSGRDGFRSTRVSLSAPLETLASGNTPAWSLLTLTHEMSHPIVEATLGLLKPRLDNSSDLDLICSWFDGRSPDNLFDQLRHLLVVAMADMDESDPSATPATLRRLIEAHGKEINELLAHALDFQYFYSRDPSRYIPGIWLTWGAVPGIQHRVRNYLTRTLCALHTSNTQRNLTTTIEQAKNELAALAEAHPNAPYIQDAMELLTVEREFFQDQLRRRTLIIGLARGFLFSERLARIFETSELSSRKAEGRPRYRRWVFPPEPPDNPLVFVEEHATNRRPHPGTSLWLMTMLAFSSKQ